MALKFQLAQGTQVREEDFGLLFYTQSGPRLYFLPCGSMLKESFFDGKMNLAQWLDLSDATDVPSPRKLDSLQKALVDLTDKGVLVEF